VSGPQLLAVVYEDDEVAEHAVRALADLAAEGGLSLSDAAVAVRSADGKGVELRQKHELAAGEGIVSGGTIGLLLGLLVGVPVAGTLVGMAGGGGLSAIDRGIPDGQMRRVGAQLEAGHAAVFALVGKVDWERLRDRLEPYGGELATAEVSDDVVRALSTPDP
jgi:uncharacterized membrane protein